MNIERTYRVVGVERETHRDVSFLVVALSESNAQVRAEQSGVIVTAVQEEPGATVQSAGDCRPVDGGKPRRYLAWRIAGSLLGGFVFMGSLGILTGTQHARKPFIDAVFKGEMSELPRLVGFLFGSNIYALIVLGIALGVLSKTRWKKGRVLLGVGVLSMAMMTVGVLRPSSQRVKIARGMQDMAKLMEGAVPRGGQTGTLPEAPIASVETHGDLAPVINITQTMMEGLYKARNRYESGVMGLGLETVLVASRLDTEAEVRDSMAKIEASQALLEEYRKSARGVVQDARDAISLLPLDAASRQALRTGLESGLSRSVPRVERLMDYEAEIYSETVAVLELMLAHQGKVRVSGERLVFDDDDAAEAFNASTGRIDGIAAKQANLTVVMQDEASRQIERLKAGDDPLYFRPVPKPVVVELDMGRCVINGTAITLPTPLGTLRDVLGEPTRVVELDHSNVHVWDQRGMYAFTERGEEHVVVLDFALNRRAENEYTPREAFQGRIMLGGVEIREIDTPRSLNRRMKGVAFGPGRHGWSIDLSTFEVCMPTVDHGLVDEFFLVRKQAEEKAEEKTNSVPRF